MKPIIIVKPKSISPQDKKHLQKEGVIVIEHANPEEIKTLGSLDTVNDSEVLIASVQSILTNTYSAHAKQLFGENLLKLIQSRLSKQPPQTNS